MSATAEAVAESIANSGQAGAEAPAGESVSDSSTRETQETSGDVKTPERLQSPGERAMNRAKERKAAASAQQTTSSSDDGQAASGEAQPQDGDSTQAGADDSTTSTEQAATSANSSSESNSSDSTVSAPESWSAEWKDRFNKLPSEGGFRELMLDQYREMQGGLTKSFESMAQERELATEYKNLQTRFNAGADDAKAVLQELAASKGIEVFFEAPQGDAGEIPEFKSTAEMMAYVRNEITKGVNGALGERDAQNRTQAEKARHVENLKSQFLSLGETNPDWVDSRDSIVERMRNAPGLSANDAYKLERTLPALQEKANLVPDLQKQVKELTAKIEKMQKRSTNPLPSDGGADSTATKEDKHLSPGQRAFKRAKQRAAQQHARN